MTRNHCACFIIPNDVLKRLAKDQKLNAAQRKAAADTAKLSAELRTLRDQQNLLTGMARGMALATNIVAATPKVTVYDCNHTHSLPGTPVPSPGSSSDATAKRAFRETTQVARFYKRVFGRNSIDDAGMGLLSSIHYGVKFNNAMWNGSQMLYGDGDASIFVDFTNGNDVIGHELTHGVTQHTLGLGYSGDAGGLNESLSDCFGSMFRQWEARQTVANADWLIGSDIMGPTAKARGFTCLRNMANPADTHALAPQPTHYSQLTPTMDPHYTSGPPNLAFCTAAKAAGGYSWKTVGPVWYEAMVTMGPQPNLKMRPFATTTRRIAVHKYGAGSKIANAVDGGWKAVGL